jgi:hypothetical protein
LALLLSEQSPNSHGADHGGSAGVVLAGHGFQGQPGGLAHFVGESSVQELVFFGVGLLCHLWFGKIPQEIDEKSGIEIPLRFRKPERDFCFWPVLGETGQKQR